MERRTFLIVVVSGLSWMSVNWSTALANCAGPTFAISASSGAPGSTVIITGRGFIEECNDTNLGGYRPLAPAKKVKIFFVQAKKKQEIGTINADAKFEISAKVVIPPNALQGSSTIIVETRYGRPLPPAAFTVKTGNEK